MCFMEGTSNAAAAASGDMGRDETEGPHRRRCWLSAAVIRFRAVRDCNCIRQGLVPMYLLAICGTMSNSK